MYIQMIEWGSVHQSSKGSVVPKGCHVINPSRPGIIEYSNSSETSVAHMCTLLLSLDTAVRKLPDKHMSFPIMPIRYERSYPLTIARIQRQSSVWRTNCPFQ